MDSPTKEQQLEVDAMIQGLREAAIHYDEMAKKLGYLHGRQMHTMTYDMLTYSYPQKIRDLASAPSLAQENREFRKLLINAKSAMECILDPLDDEELSQPVYKQLSKSIFEIKEALKTK